MRLNWGLWGGVLAGMFVFALHFGTSELLEATFLACAAFVAASTLGFLTSTVLHRIYPAGAIICIGLSLSIGLENDAVMSVAGVVDAASAAEWSHQVVQATFDFIVAGAACSFAVVFAASTFRNWQPAVAEAAAPRELPPAAGNGQSREIRLSALRAADAPQKPPGPVAMRLSPSEGGFHPVVRTSAGEGR